MKFFFCMSQQYSAMSDVRGGLASFRSAGTGFHGVTEDDDPVITGTERSYVGPIVNLNVSDPVSWNKVTPGFPRAAILGGSWDGSFQVFTVDRKARFDILVNLDGAGGDTFRIQTNAGAFQDFDAAAPGNLQADLSSGDTITVISQTAAAPVDGTRGATSILITSGL